MSSSIILNIRMNYLPQSLIQSADCNDRCLNVLVGEII